MPLLFLLTGIMSLGYGSVFTLLADIRDRFGFDDASVGLIAFAGFATGFASQVFLARYADRGHPRSCCAPASWPPPPAWRGCCSPPSCGSGSAPAFCSASGRERSARRCAGW